jgi:hypothetical protein
MKTIATLVLLGSMVSAVSADEVVPGSRVRVTSKGSIAHVGTLVGIDDEGITVRGRDGRARLLPAVDVRHLEVSRRPSRRGQGFLVGSVLGGFAGFAIGMKSNKSNHCNPAETFCLFGREGLFSDEQSGAMAAVPGALVGGLIGALATGERWQRVEDRRVQLRLAPSRRGGLELAVRF